MEELVRMDRRALMQQVALLIGAASLPAGALAAKPAAKARRFLAPAAFQALTAIADTIIPATDTPGAAGVGVPALFDRLLVNWASASRRTELAATIADIDKRAMASDKKAFVALTPARRKALLLDYDKEALKPGKKLDRPLNVFEALAGGAPVANPGWLKLKELVISLYYNSEVACTKELVYEHVPGKFVPSLKVTADSRPFAGAGPF